jgi:hypothetical protein
LIPRLAEILGVTPADFFTSDPPCDQGPLAELARRLARSWDSWPLADRHAMEAFIQAIEQERKRKPPSHEGPPAGV